MTSFHDTEYAKSTLGPPNTLGSLRVPDKKQNNEF